MSSDIKRSFDLPLGYTATFEWRGNRLVVGWEPDIPHIQNQRALRKFLTAYESARQSFFTDIAAVMGSTVLLVDVGKGIEALPPPVPH
jgi:hypothetical protein